MSPKFKLVSLNVRGLRNQSKRGAIFSYLKSQKATIYCLQETYSLASDEREWSSEWGGRIIFSHGTAHSKGVCILLNPNSIAQFCCVHSDAQGRLIIAKIKIEEEIFFVINIYAPSNYNDQENFVQTLSEQIISKTDTSRAVIAGDWNLTLNRIDKQGGLAWKPTASRNAVADLMDELNLVDIYRQLHPHTKSFTYESKPLKLKSRIDFILISHPISFNVKRRDARINSTRP